MLPTFIGVGGKKCGSTWLSECLREHPEIFMSSPKEVNFFSGRRYKNLGLEWYKSFFPESGNFKAVGEFSPDYLYRPGAPKRIHQTLSECKLLIVLRNPLERFLSDYKQAKRGTSLPDHHVITLQEIKDIENRRPGLIQYSLYSNALKRYLAYFNRQRVLIFKNEQLAAQPEKSLRTTFEFLGADPEFKPSIYEKTVSAGGLKRFPQLERARVRLHESLKYALPQAIDWVKKSGLAEWYRKANSKDVTIALAPDARAYLTELFMEDLRYLSRITQIDFTDWENSIHDGIRAS